MELDSEGTKCLKKIQQANNSCWNALREDLSLPERCQLAEAIRDGEPEFLTPDLWSQNTLLRRAEWEEYETAINQSCMTFEEPLAILIETGVIVAKGHVFGYGPPAARGEHFPITRLRDALLRLVEHYPHLDDDALDVSESRLDGVPTESQISLEQVICQCCETIHVVLLDSLSSGISKTRRGAVNTNRSKKKPPRRDTPRYQWLKDRVREIRRKKRGATREHVRKELKRECGQGIGGSMYQAIMEDLLEEEAGKPQEPDSSEVQQ